METESHCKSCGAPVDYMKENCPWCNNFYSRYMQVLNNNKRYLEENEITDVAIKGDYYFNTNFMECGVACSAWHCQYLKKPIFEFGFDIAFISGSDKTLSYMKHIDYWMDVLDKDIKGTFKQIPVLVDEFSEKNIMTIFYKDNTTRKIILENLE